MPRSLHLLNFFYLGSNLITNNVNAISLPRTTPGNTILGLEKWEGIAILGCASDWHCSPILKALDGIARCCTRKTNGILSFRVGDLFSFFSKRCN